MASICRVDLAGPIPAAQLSMIRSRFDGVALRTAGTGSVLECRVADQSATRALQNLLWNVGSEIRSFASSVLTHEMTPFLTNRPTGE